MNFLNRLTNMRFSAVFLFTVVAGVIAWRHESAAGTVMMAAASLASIFVGSGEAKDTYIAKYQAALRSPPTTESPPNVELP